MGPFNVFEFKTKQAFDDCDFSDADTSEYLPKDCKESGNCTPDGPFKTTSEFGTPVLTAMQKPVRYFGGSPTTYCQAGQKLEATGTKVPVPGNPIKYNLADWGNPSKWTTAGFKFSFLQPADQIIFQYPNNAAPPPKCDDVSAEYEYPEGKFCSITYEPYNVCYYDCDVGWDDAPPCKCASCGCYNSGCCLG